MKRIILGLALAAATSIGTAAQPSLQHRVESIVKRSSALNGAAVGIMVKRLDGTTLAALNADQRLVPASNLKLITTGTALNSLGPDYRFKTAIGHTGTISDDGTLDGDIYIIGGGDPTIGADEKDFGRLPFPEWTGILLKAGIRAVNGRIIGDSRLWEGHLEFGDWTYEDIGTYYGTGAGALSFYKNAIDLNVAAGAVEGAPVQAEQTYPDTPWMHFTNSGITGKEGTGNSLYLYTTDLAPCSELRGSFAKDKSPKTEHFANKFGALTCSYYYYKYLTAQGFKVTGGAADIDAAGRIRTSAFVPMEPAGDPEVIGHTESAPLRDIARRTNVESDNFYAEAMFRTMGEETSGYAVYDSARVAEASALRKLGLNPEGAIIMDGSGLSRRNAVSARFINDFLQAMTSRAAFPDFLKSLPAPGEGTLAPVLKSNPSRERFRLKSGSMEGALCYSGYLLDADGTPVATISLLVNGSTAITTQIRKALEAILEELLLYL